MHPCLRVPELLAEIALNLSRLADISSLSRCDHMFHESVMPLLFRNISIYLQEAPTIASVLKNNPHVARLCNTFSFKGSDPELTKDVQAFDFFFDQLAIVLATLADQANVKVVSWCIRATYANRSPIAVPINVWQALGRLSDSLEQLHLNILQKDEYWETICEPMYPKLRFLRLVMLHAHGWDCSSLQTMLNRLQQLEILHLYLPTCCGPTGLDLSSSHPQLRAFLISAEDLDGSALYFLKRHPTIECLNIEDARGHVLDDQDLPLLKALHLDGEVALDTPALLALTARRQLTHLHFHDIPYLTSDVVHDLVNNISSSLQHLEIECGVDGFRKSIPGFSRLLHLLPRLEELRATAYSVNTFPQPEPLSGEDLSAFLSSIHGSTNIARLRLTDRGGDDLPQSQLDDMGIVPPSLEYLSWHVKSRLSTYHLQGRDGKTVAVPAELSNTGTPLDMVAHFYYD